MRVVPRLRSVSVERNLAYLPRRSRPFRSPFRVGRRSNIIHPGVRSRTLLCPPRLRGVELPVALFDAAGFPSRYRCFSATTSSDSSGSAGSLARPCATKGAHDCSRRQYDGAGSYPAVRGGPSGPERTPCSSKMKSVRFATYHLTEI